MSLLCCPVPGCENARNEGHLMCCACWWSVPKPVRERVWRAWEGAEGQAE
jgi:hypothetical protein